MADIKTFHLPDLGEGLPDATVVDWFVKEGDVVKLDAPLVSMETAKAVVGLDIVQFGNADAGRGTIMKVKMADKLGALTTLARHHGLLNDKLKIGEDPDNPLTGLMTFLQAGAGRIKPGAK